MVTHDNDFELLLPYTVFTMYGLVWTTVIHVSHSTSESTTSTQTGPPAEAVGINTDNKKPEEEEDKDSNDSWTWLGKRIQEGRSRVLLLLCLSLKESWGIWLCQIPALSTYIIIVVYTGSWLLAMANCHSFLQSI